jgi:hypothetical protein
MAVVIYLIGGAYSKTPNAIVSPKFRITPGILGANLKCQFILHFAALSM